VAYSAMTAFFSSCVIVCFTSLNYSPVSQQRAVIPSAGERHKE